jgi:hypothetical protein
MSTTPLFSFAAALHTYLRVDDIAEVRLEGLQGANRWDSLRDDRHVETAPALRFDAEFDSVYAAPGEAAAPGAAERHARNCAKRELQRNRGLEPRRRCWVRNSPTCLKTAIATCFAWRPRASTSRCCWRPAPNGRAGSSFAFSDFSRLRPTMLAKRIIPCLDVTGGRVVKGVNFLELRDAGDPVEIAARYNAQGADELTFLDITATSDGRDLILPIIEAVASQVFIPLTVGGGVRTVADVRRLLNAGADKTSFNSAAIADPKVISDASQKYGSQCIVVAIDAKRRSPEEPPRAARAGTCTAMAAARTPAWTPSRGRPRWRAAAPARSC